MTWRRRWVQFWLTAVLVLPVHAQMPEPDLVLGRADADASGGWPVALWVIDGDKASFIVSAPRNELGELPGARWTPVDAQALMSLERFGAPQLHAQTDADPCPAALSWGRAMVIPPNAHWPGERVELRHAACSTRDCAQRQAWRIELPPGSGETLPLAQLIPGLVSHGSQWLVLHVASRHSWPGLAEVRELVVPPALRLSVGWDREPVLPLSSAQYFPAIHEALLLHAARGQKLDSVSTLLHNNATGAVAYRGYVRNWDASEAQREALGLQSPSLLRGGYMTRLLLRLQPSDLPATLSLTSRTWTPDASFLTLHALVPRPEGVEACHARLAALQCEPACAERTANLPQWSLDREAIARLKPAERLPACLRACEAQKRSLREGMARNFEAVDSRQRMGWQWVEALTGRGAADWQRQP